MSDETLALVRRFPELAGRLPRLPLCALPTPVHRWDKAGPALGVDDLWVKRDDLTHSAHGGNKVRKLELCLGEAKARGAQVLLTAAATGSNWAAACVHFAREHGLPARLILYERPLTPRGEANLRYVAAHAEHVRRIPSVLTLPWHRWREERANAARKPYWIPTGGTSALTSLGFVSAALELVEQVEQGAMPAPDAIVVALGTGGTLGGLLAGFRLAGFPVESIGVRVVDRIVSNVRAVRRLAAGCLARLGKTAPEGPCRLTVFHGAFGRGYALSTPEGDAAQALVRDTEGIELDPTYTAKCVAGLRAMAASGALRGKRVLYWHTLNPVPPEAGPGG